MTKKTALGLCAPAILIALFLPAFDRAEAQTAARRSIAADSAAAASRFLYVWAGDADMHDSDFLAVLDARTGTASYGRVLTTVPVGAKGTMPHHTEFPLVVGRFLFANGFEGDRTWLFELAPI